MREPAVAPLRLATERWLREGHGVAVQENVLTTGIELHWHEFFELSYVEAGAGSHTVNGVVQPLGAGDVLVLTPADFHELRPDPGATLLIINVVYTDELLPPRLRASWPARPVVHMPELAADFRRVATDSHHTDPLSTLALQSTLVRILVDVARTATSNGAGPRRAAHRADVRRALRWVDHHFREPIRLADAAAVACVSAHHFSGLFRAATGVSFQDYLMDRRLQFARGLLRSADLPVSQVCHVAGYNDLTHFTRSYRRRFGQPPSVDRVTG